MEEENSHLVFAMMRFLEQELLRSDMTPDAKESLEVGVQCLENVYSIFSSDPLVKAKYSMPAPLPEIFKAGLAIKSEEYKPKEISEDDKTRADKHKADGNELMKCENYTGAILQYTNAIEIDDRNAVYFCNRAAAYSKSNNHTKALEDCLEALTIDPKYSKAYGRKGLAHSALNQYGDAKESFERALELDPDNESYKKNLEVAEQKLTEQQGGMQAPPGAFPGMPAAFPGMPGGGEMNFSQLLNNPALMNMASQMMQSPHMQEMMANLMGGMQGGQEGEAPNMGNILQMGQQFAQQMSQQNPELVEQLRQMGGNQEGGADTPDNNDNPEQTGDQ